MLDWQALERTVRRDPGGRGLASFLDESGRPLLAGQLAAAADYIPFGKVAIGTGFCVHTADGPTAETDGPPGAVYLAWVLRSLHHDAVIVTDRFASPAVRAGLQVAGLPADLLVELPQDSNDERARSEVAAWRDAATHRDLPTTERVKTFIALERVGPSHTSDSIAGQFASPREAELIARSRSDLPPDYQHVREQIVACVAEFESLVPESERDRCHNMRGEIIDAHTAPLHVLFEFDESSQPGRVHRAERTIGIVDGGNEIGCGSIPWSTLRRAVAKGPAAQTACRVKTDRTIVAGVSNWGAYALAAGFAARWNAVDLLRDWDAERQRRVIEAMVADGGAVDGVTKRREATVDGLALDDYLAVFEEIRRIALS